MPGAEAPARKIGFAPVVDDDTRLLILGSLPGDASLKAGQYYGHPRNAFWRLVGGVIGCDLTTLPYPDRLERLKAARVGLWDVIAQAHRPGSLDQAIRDVEASDLPGLTRVLPNLEAVAFNGATAARIGRRQLAQVRRLTLIDLPSSSPAHTLAIGEKAARWGALSPWISQA